MKKSLFCCFFALPMLLGATDWAPWTGVDLELHPRITNELERYPSHTVYILGAGLQVSYDVYDLDLEANMAHTADLLFSFNDFRLTAKYRLLSDTLGDFITLTPGITLIQATHHSLDDPELFHHGMFEAEFHVAAGKEWTCREFWTSRVWLLGAIGQGNRGSPWLRGDFAIEKNWWDEQSVRLYVHTLWGLGCRKLHTHDFHGYGSIHHQSVDVGIKYITEFIWGSELTLGYSYRPYARNFPKYVSTYLLELMVPLGI